MTITSLLCVVRRRARALLVLVVFHAAGAAAADTSQDFWQNIQAAPLPTGAPAVSVYRPLSLDIGRMNARLASARHSGAAVTLALPHPDGSFSEFLLVDSRVMPDALQDKYPSIVSLAGSDAQGRKARVDISNLGFQAMVFDQDGIWIVRPETYGMGDRYLSFRRMDLALPGQQFQCGVHGDALDPSGMHLLSQPAPMTVTGATERVYRAAVAANHQYVAAVGGGTVAGGLAAIVTAMNRVDGVYERELGDPHGADRQRQSHRLHRRRHRPLHQRHGTPCWSRTRATSTASSARPTTTSATSSRPAAAASPASASCRATAEGARRHRPAQPDRRRLRHRLRGPRDGAPVRRQPHLQRHHRQLRRRQPQRVAAYEPGSGTTIMAYAGICGADDLQPHCDPYFHSKSLEEINTWIEGNGGACSAESSSTDAAPVIDTASLPPEVTIPMHTAFALSGSAADSDGDSLTYNWEQYDLGPATTLAQGDTGDGPIFRSFNATASGTRIFPKIESVLGAPLVKGETWPITTRDLSFRLTVRDNHDVSGAPQFGATVSANAIQIHVTDTAGPFNVTRPNTAITWGRGETHSVTWDVAGTDAPPSAATLRSISRTMAARRSRFPSPRLRRTQARRQSWCRRCPIRARRASASPAATASSSMFRTWISTSPRSAIRIQAARSPASRRRVSRSRWMPAPRAPTC